MDSVSIKSADKFGLLPADSGLPGWAVVSGKQEKLRRESNVIPFILIVFLS